MVLNNAASLAGIFLSKLALEPGVLVRVVAAEGSVPREAGTWMAVFVDSLAGTIGGGRLEHEAIAIARAQLQASSASGEDEAEATGPGEKTSIRFALGPALGQCCGGVVHLSFEVFGASDIPTLALRLNSEMAANSATPVALFGGGHVGQALVRVLAPLPFLITWIDSRDEVFPDSVSESVACEHSEPVHAAVAGLAPQSRVLIMSFSHAEDLDVVAACLKRQRLQGDLPYIGLIGSQTKWARFRHQLEARGVTPAELAHITCPIGIPGITGKEPEVIAVAVAAQLLQTLANPPVAPQ